jgi:hypothetical protein
MIYVNTESPFGGNCCRHLREIYNFFINVYFCSLVPGLQFARPWKIFQELALTMRRFPPQNKRTAFRGNEPIRDDCNYKELHNLYSSPNTITVTIWNTSGKMEG